jgi:hypothetical protein
MNFRDTIELAGKTATGIEVPAAVVAKLGSSKKPAVHSPSRAVNRLREGT